MTYKKKKVEEGVPSKTLHIGSDLHSTIRIKAAQLGITVQQLVESALIAYLKK
jgi:predicted HicB family RNase H-like nuclease